MKTDGFIAELECEVCHVKFKIFDPHQIKKKYCSEKCKKLLEKDRKKRIRAQEKKEGKKTEKKPKEKKPKTYRDPDTGSIYIQELDTLDDIRKKSQAAGLSYGQYTARDYAPQITYTNVVQKEKEYNSPSFVWKSSRTERRKKN